MNETPGALTTAVDELKLVEPITPLPIFTTNRVLKGGVVMGHAFAMVTGITICVLTFTFAQWVHDKMHPPSQQYAAHAAFDRR